MNPDWRTSTVAGLAARIRETNMIDLYQCPRCKSGPRPRDQWASRYGIMTCGACLQSGYVILPENLKEHGKMCVYVASRASIPERGRMWRELRSKGYPIISSWIDEDGEGQTECFSDLWSRIEDEVKRSCALVLYVEEGDFPLKGALIEVGIALAAKVPVFVVAPGVNLDARSMRPLGSWAHHPLVTIVDGDASDALDLVSPVVS